MCMSFFFTLLNHALLVLTHLRWACKFLLHPSLFHHRQFNERYSGETIGAWCYDEPAEMSDRMPEDRRICLCRIEEGEEIKELRCDHLFHSDCFHRWFGHWHGHAKCPLCSGTLEGAAPESLAQVGEEVLVFKFCSFDSNEQREAWWLR